MSEDGQRRKGKRGHGEGAIYEQDGRWRAVVDLGWDNGKRKRKYLSGKTKREVLQKLALAQQANANGVPLPAERLTVGAFLERWLVDAVKPKVRPRTYASYAQLVRLHIAPSLGRTALVKLTPQAVQKWLNAKQTEKRACPGNVVHGIRTRCPAPHIYKALSPRTACYLRAVLRRALNQALKWGEVSRNVATLVDPPRSVTSEVVPFTPDECRRLLDAARGDRLEALYTVALALGLRQGEALGLRWEDVELDAATLRVRTQLQKLDGAVEFTEPKSATSRRVISLPPFAVTALREHRLRQLEERLRVGDAWTDWGLVFPSSVGTPLDGHNVSKYFKRLLARAELPPRRFHDMRHTCATLLLLQEVPDRVVMEILGHSQLSMTARYSHVVSSMKKDAATRMHALLSAP